MYLDIRTLQVATIVACSVLGPISLAFGPGQPHMRPSRFWGAGLMGLAAGLALISLRGHGPTYLSQVVGPGLVGLALAFAQASARSALDESGRDIVGWTLLGVFLMVLVILDRTASSASLRHFAVAMMMGGLACRVAYSFERGKDRREGVALRMIGMIFALIGLSLMLHGAFDLAGRNDVGTSETGMGDAIALVGISAGLLLGTILLLWVMTERIQLRLQELGSLDALTGVLNRMAFAGEFEREASRAERRADAGFAILLVNMDHLRRVNDAFGHQAGDRVLVAAAELLRKGARKYDVIGRLEGDVFVLLAPGAGGESAAAIAERMRRDMELQVSVLAGLKNRVTASIGVTEYMGSGGSWATLLRAAESAVENARKSGGNLVRIAAPMEPVRETRAAGSALSPP